MGEQPNLVELDQSQGRVQRRVREEYLRNREDEQAQLDHLTAVKLNIMQLRANVAISDEEKMIEEFVWAHDVGKWGIGEVIEDYNKNSEEVLKTLEEIGLSKEEIKLFKRGVCEDANGYHSEQDIAHHLFSAYLYQKMIHAGDVELNTKQSKQVLDAILEHQFGAYYKGEAKRLDYSQDEIDAITRPPTKGLSEEFHDGDILCMTQVALRPGEDSELILGGMGKILMIELRINAQQNSEKTMSRRVQQAVQGAVKSSNSVFEELKTSKAREIYNFGMGERSRLIDKLKEDSELIDSLETEAEVEAYLRKIGPKLLESGQETVQVIVPDSVSVE